MQSLRRSAVLASARWRILKNCRWESSAAGVPGVDLEDNSVVVTEAVRPRRIELPNDHVDRHVRSSGKPVNI